MIVVKSELTGVIRKVPIQEPTVREGAAVLLQIFLAVKGVFLGVTLCYFTAFGFPNELERLLRLERRRLLFRLLVQRRLSEGALTPGKSARLSPVGLFWFDLTL